MSYFNLKFFSTKIEERRNPASWKVWKLICRKSNFSYPRNPLLRTLFRKSPFFEKWVLLISGLKAVSQAKLSSFKLKVSREFLGFSINQFGDDWRRIIEWWAFWPNWLYWIAESIIRISTFFLLQNLSRPIIAFLNFEMIPIESEGLKWIKTMMQNYCKTIASCLCKFRFQVNCANWELRFAKFGSQAPNA